MAARVVNKTSNANLEVTGIKIPFIRWLFSGDYNIIGLGDVNE